ncbi:tyrosine-type recombinase/integrase [Cellulomonas hominis]|uniref:tyrosine-type recombinase/integrase n=1 Tax=Cellulomonas hominis TaxID=156981 RepID=UPI001B3492ED
MLAPDAAQRLRVLPGYRAAPELAQRNAELCIARLLIRTGKHVEQLRADDLLEYADVVRTSRRKHREHLAWELLVALGPLAGAAPTLRSAWAASTRSRQLSVEILVDRYGIGRSPVRDLLVEYLNEVKTGMDYGSLRALAYRLVRLFWLEVLAINPDQVDLRLSKEVATRWRERLATTLDGQPRREMHSTIFGVRAFYRDISEWSYEDPGRWGVWVAPCPIAKNESMAYAKASRRRRAAMHDRTRMLTPNLPKFRATATEMKEHGRRLMDAALAASHGELFVVDGVTYARHSPPVSKGNADRAMVWADVVDTGSAPAERGARLCITRVEADGFWGWAVTETLSETGVRIEELVEATQLSLRHYVAPTTNTIIPLLHIVPSKTDAERLIPMSPDLVKVLLDVQRRARGESSLIPLSVRYDPTEKTFSDPLPHLFARLVGARQEVLSMAYIRKILNAVADRAGIYDAGVPVRFTPHDFRRLFSTDMVGSGLPLHIVATVLGHLSLETTRGYTAVFPEQVVQAHHAYIERRRQARPEGELRPATEEEWKEFEEHFLRRKVALGDCFRPYATPCVHENACTRCRFLDVDPAQSARLDEMTANAESRLDEARSRVWLGEVSALEESLVHLRRRRDEADAKLAQRAASTGA